MLSALRTEWRNHPAGDDTGEIRFLRRFSNYLTPKLGWFGADTLDGNRNLSAQHVAQPDCDSTRFLASTVQRDELKAFWEKILDRIAR